MRTSDSPKKPSRDVQMPQGQRGSVITFASFRVDLLAGQLLRGSEPIPLRPKTWTMLQYLAQRPGVLVSKNDLLDAVWPDVTVTEWVLSKSIRELRVALHDNTKTPRFIETVQRRGFRFIAPIDAEPHVPSSSDPSAHYPSQESSSPLPFVGRTEELQRLLAAFANALDGERRHVFVSGEAGIGKTALVRTFLDSLAVRAAAMPVWIARGTCVGQHGVREAYMPILEGLEVVARRPDAGRLIELMRRIAPTWLTQMPGLISDADQAALRQSLQAVRPERMVREFATLIDALTAEVAIVLVVEDLQWSDPCTIDLLWALAQRREPARLLTIGTFRPAEAIVQEHTVMKVMRTLALHRQCIELPLSYLHEEDVLRYLDERLPGNDFPPTLARVIRQHTDGNPLFMSGVIDHLLSQGFILETAPGWSLRAPLEKITLGIPDDVRLLIENDLEGLSPADRALLQAASVAGEDFSPLVVAAALGCEEADVETRCEAFVQARRFLRVTGHVEWPDHSVSRRYGFVHELYRRAVYAQIDEGHCMQLHRRIGQALEAAYGARQTEIAPKLATHFERGHDDARALRYLSVAAARARLRFANREALEYLDAALGLLARGPEDDERRRQELGFCLARGAILIDVRGFASEEVRESFERAGGLCAAVGTRPQLFDTLYARWYLHAMRNERDATITVAAELNDLARRLGTVPQRVVALSVLVRTACYDARFAEAVRRMRRLARMSHQKEATRPAFGPDPVMAASMHAALALWMLGQPQQARAIARSTVERARKLGHFFTLTAVLMQAAFVELLCRNAVTGSALAEEAMSFAATHGFVYWQALISVLTGWALTQQSQAADGNAAIETALTAMQATGTRFLSAFAYGFLAEGYLKTGGLEEGLAAADAGLAVAQTSLDRAYTPELWRLKGELLLLRVESRQPVLSNVEGSRVERKEETGTRRAVDSRLTTLNAREAEACFQRALDGARASRAKSLELRAATSLARSWHAHGRTAPARRLLSGICAWFGPRGTSPDLVDARALLNELRTVREKSVPARV